MLTPERSSLPGVALGAPRPVRAALKPLGGLAALWLFATAPALAAIFNDLLPGARPMGMGMAYVAVSDDPYGMFYNPAGLAGANLTQLGLGLGRMISPVGTLSLNTATYLRPLPILPGSTVGAGLMVLRQNNAGDKDEFLLHFSDSISLPQLYLSEPLKYGANFKSVQVDNQADKKGAKFGMGFDAGVMVEDEVEGLKGGVSVNDLVTSVGVPNPSLNFGAAYTWNHRILFASDLRIRTRLTQFFPGVEARFLNDMLKLRLGKGLPLDGVGQVAFGAGIDLSPLVLDFAMTVPFNGFNRQGGGFQMSLNYKFGAPAFYGRFVGSAAREAEDLRAEIFALEKRKKELQAQTDAAEADKTASEGQAKALETRMRELQKQSGQMQLEMERSAYEVAHPPLKAPPNPAAPSPPPPKPEKPRIAGSFPKRHQVVPGDTLRSLAEKYYGDPNLWEQIYNANAAKVERGLPMEGTELIIPAPKER